ncbi:magnesium chelatase subunit D [Jannaschia sp. S6380]|uniref:magnesium chelatase subunit D n=1 Tax=Jannaschia sp. S6380 TaxID=2926408 RepID=UPI001FF45497|nr:magnesium chelatase subunit D [Jannaschia sp. S6380]MCK0167690.1 magnesium chelatase subunit D [Jannaschia sp. S6380]
MGDAGRSAWSRAACVRDLLAIDPVGLGGVVLRARAGPVRDTFLAGLTDLPAPVIRLPPTTMTDRLTGGIDVTATIAAGRRVSGSGLLEGAGAAILPMAERLRPDLAVHIARAMDDCGLCVIAVDEGIDEDAAPASIAERAAFALHLADIAMADIHGPATGAPALARARRRLAAMQSAPELAAPIALAAMRFGIDSLRAPLLTLRAARAHAALHRRDAVEEPDLLAAVDLVLSHRVTHLPDTEATDLPTPPPGGTESAGADTDRIAPSDMLVEAVRANLPADILDRLAERASRTARGAGSGARRKGNRRGRPLPARPGRYDGSAAIDIVATLRAAAPWQTIRARTARTRRAVHVMPSDIHLKRFEEKSDRLLIFTVDASGSAAFARLAEAKGAVELLLGAAYARRDHVALIAFRGTGAELLLPPTRSLVQTKRRLAALPGGGGTPLAAGLACAMDLAIAAGRRGMTPAIALLTDGRANIALDGAADRERARADATRTARALAGQGCSTIVVDMGNRPEPDLAELGRTLGGHYLPLPRADAHRLSGAVAAALGT